MKSLQKDFLKRSVAALEDLSKRAKNKAVLTSEFVREAFRTLHTIKGTSQTFGFSASAKIAHELENLLSDAKENDGFFSDEFKDNLLKGLAYLIDSFTQTDDLKVEKSFSDKKSKAPILPKDFTFEAEFLNQFSEHEKKSIVSEVNKGKNLFIVRADFDLSNFSDEFKKLREKLSEKGEIIATLSNSNTIEKGKIGFRICVASNESEIKLNQVIKEFSADIVRQKPIPENNLDKILKQIAAHGKDLAERFEKNIEIEISAAQISISVEKAKLIFDILLHLTRNAIDHAFEKTRQKAKIEILLKSEKEGVKLLVKDNGKGIDTEKIARKAIEKKLLSSDKTLTESELLDLIFLHEFSTAETLTEISGRGVGLDAVKNLVENAGGTINVKSQRDFGTTFEVFLRYEK